MKQYVNDGNLENIRLYGRKNQKNAFGTKSATPTIVFKKI